MIYTIRFTALSSNDLSGIFEYIAIDLCDEGAAKKLFQKQNQARPDHSIQTLILRWLVQET